MTLQLFLDLNNLDYYGDIPEVPNDPEGRVEELNFIMDDEDFFSEDISDINFACNSLLDIGDVDFFNPEQCESLMRWIESRNEKPIDARYKEILDALYNFAQRAIELKTGVVVEL